MAASCAIFGTDLAELAGGRSWYDFRICGPHRHLRRRMALAAQTEDPELAEQFTPLAEALAGDEDAIVRELIEVQGAPVDIGGYCKPDSDKTVVVMRPSQTLNPALAAVNAESGTAP